MQAVCTHRAQSENMGSVRGSVTVPSLFTRRTKSVVMSLQTIKEGNLYKRGKINTEWRQRLFVLNGKQLAYFKGGVSVAAWSLSLSLSLSLSFSRSCRTISLIQY